MTLLPPYSTNVWRAILVSAGLLFVIGAVFLFSDKCSTFNFNRGMKQANANLAKEIDKLSNIQDQQATKEKELQQLAIDEAVQKQAIIQAAKDKDEAAKIERGAQIAANQANANVEAVNAQDFNGTTLDNAQKARCKAFPDAPECK